jgi:Mg/Co/Ni transporter MgtE
MIEIGTFLVGFFTFDEILPTIKNESKANIIAGNESKTPKIVNLPEYSPS